MADKKKVDFLFPMELDDAKPSEDHEGEASSSVPSTDRGPLQIAHVFDRLIKVLADTETQTDEHNPQSLADEWDDCECATDYQAPLNRIMALTYARYAEQKDVALKHRGDLESARTKLRMHVSFLDRNGHELSEWLRQKYQNDATEYGRTAKKIEVSGPHLGNIADFGFRILIHVREVSDAVNEAVLLENKLFRDIEVPNSPDPVTGPERAGSEDSQETASDLEVARDNVTRKHIVGPVTAQVAATTLQSIEMSARAAGRMIDSLLEEQRVERTKMDVKLAGWDDVESLPDEAFVAPSSGSTTYVLR